MIQNRYSVEAIILGRNDEYEPNWTEKLFASIAYNRERFEGSAVDYRVAFVEWNPPRNKPLLSPALLEKFNFLRAIAVDADVHDRLSTSPRLVMMLNFAINCALRTSQSDFCLIAAGDLFIGQPLAGYLRTIGLARNCLYRAERVNIRDDLNFIAAMPGTIEDPANIISINTCTEPPYDVPPYTHACGDFLLCDRLSMLGVRGFDESIRSARLHLDSRFCWTAIDAGLHCNLIGQIFHINHRQSFSNLLDDYPDTKYNYHSNLPYLNPREWGLADHTWKRRENRYWYVSKPSGDGGVTIPEELSELDIDAINSVTKRIIARKRTRVPDEDSTDMHVLATPSLDLLAAKTYFFGAKVVHGSPSVVYTPGTPWSYSATLELAPLRELHHHGDGWLFWEIEAEVQVGKVGFSMFDRGHVSHEKSLAVAQGRQRIYLPADVIGAELLVRNGEYSEISRVAIYGVRLIQQKPLDFDENDILLRQSQVRSS